MNAKAITMDTAENRLAEFLDLLARCQAAAKEERFEDFRALDHQLRNVAMALIGAMPTAEPGDHKYFDAMRDAVTKLGETAQDIEKDRQRLKSRQQADRKVRLAYARGAGRL
jgi:hypothetical protein